MFSPHETAQITHDFIRGELRLPPRFRERGPEFAWNAHMLGWWRRLQLFAAARPPAATADNANARTTTAVVIFDEMLVDPVAAVRELLRFCNITTAAGAGAGAGMGVGVGAGAAAAAATTRDEEEAAAAAVIAARATREVTARVVTHARGDSSNAAEAAAHFPASGGSGSGGIGSSNSCGSIVVIAGGGGGGGEQKPPPPPPPTWAREFFALPADMQALFNRSHSAWDLVVASGATRWDDGGEGEGGEGDGGGAVVAGGEGRKREQAEGGHARRAGAVLSRLSVAVA